MYVDARYCASEVQCADVNAPYESLGSLAWNAVSGAVTVALEDEYSEGQ